MKKNKDRSVSKFALSMLLLVVLVLSTGLAIRKKEGKIVRNAPREFVNFLRSQDRYMSPLELSDKIIQEDPTILLIDLRDPKSFTAFSLPGALNIAPDSLIKSVELLKHWGKRELVLFDNDERHSNATWLLAKQIGYENIYILQGGLNSWFEHILEANEATGSVYKEDLQNHALRKSAGMYFGVYHEPPAYIRKEEVKTLAPKKISSPKKEVNTTPKKKKKMPEGGC